MACRHSCKPEHRRIVATHDVRWMFHSTAIMPDYHRATTVLQSIAGLRVLQCNENPGPEIGRRSGMTWVGDNSLEIGQPIVESGGAASFVARTGGGMRPIALQVRDLEATMEHLRECGVGIAARPLPDMCFTDPATPAVFFEWTVFEVDIDPRFGAEPGEFAAEPLLGIREHAFIGALVRRPRSGGPTSTAGCLAPGRRSRNPALPLDHRASACR